MHVIDNYSEIKKLFLDILDMSKTITFLINSKNDLKYNNDPDIFGVVMFTRIYTISDSIRKLLPNDINHKDEYPDYNSIFSLSRNLIECVESLFYISFDVNDPNTKRFRLTYFNFFNFRIWIDHFKKIGDKEKRSEYISAKRDAIFLIQSNPIFMMLGNSDRRAFIKAKYKFFGYSRASLAKRMNYIDGDLYLESHYMFSASAHSYPPSLYPMAYRSFNSNEGMQWEIEYISTALIISAVYLAKATRDMINNVITYTKFIYVKFSDHEKAILSEALPKLESLISVLDSKI